MIEELLKKYKQYPTMMDISQEIEMMNDIMMTPQSELLQNKETFRELLDILSTSHCGGGIFEVNGDNIQYFESFSRFLKEIAKFFGSKRILIEMEAKNIKCRFSMKNK